MPASRLPIALPDYQRIFRVLHAVLDSVQADQARARIFLGVAGALLLQRVYNKPAQAVAGSAFYKVDDEAGSVLTFAGAGQSGNATAQDAPFHCWVFCESHVIDFSAPLFREFLQAAGVTGSCSRKMFQKPLPEIADSPLRMQQPGDFYLLPDVALTKQILQSYEKDLGNHTLFEICKLWYRKPPKEVVREMTVQDTEGQVHAMTLSGLTISGAW